MHRIGVLLLLVSFALVPVGAAAPAATDATAALRGDIACPLGDINADGVGDLLLRARTEAGDQLRALSGAAHTQVLWSLDVADQTELTCGPDADLDGVADVLLEEIEAAQGNVPDVDGVDASDAQATLHAIAGASGASLLELTGTQSTRASGTAGAGGSTRTDLELAPASAGVYLLVHTEETVASASLLDGLSLTGGDADVTLDILDATGEVTGTIEAAEGSRILDFATVAQDAAADATAEVSVLVLSAAEASPVDEIPAHVPTVASYRVDGTLAWATQLDATTADLSMLPQAGDVDADGVEDLVVGIAPADGTLSGASSFSVLSGADGSVLLSRAVDAGHLAALPLGDLTPEVPDDADALLVVTQASADASAKLEAIVAGETRWTADLPAGALPVNGAVDDFTGELEGLLDLTGDGVPDVAALVEENGASALTALDGADGTLAWELALEGAAQVHAIAGAAGADLAVVGLDGSDLSLSRVDGASGSVEWAMSTTLAGGIGQPDVDVLSLAEENGDVESLVMTVRDAAPAAEGVTPIENVYEIDPDTGETTWSGSTTDGGAVPAALVPDESTMDAPSKSPVPAPAPLALVGLAAAVALVAARLRRR